MAGGGVAVDEVLTHCGEGGGMVGGVHVVVVAAGAAAGVAVGGC